jgi:hypothetical protein
MIGFMVTAVVRTAERAESAAAADGYSNRRPAKLPAEVWRARSTLAAGAAAITLAVVTPCGLALAKPSEPGVVNYAIMGRGAVANIVGAPMGAQWEFAEPLQAYSVDIPACNNWADIGLPEVFNDPDLASFHGATTQTSPADDTHLVKQAVGVFATTGAATAAYHRIIDRTIGCAGQTATMRLDPPGLRGPIQVWSFTGEPPGATDANWVKQEAGTDRRCFSQTRLRENVLLQAKVCQSGNAGPAVNVLAGAMQNTLGQ